MPRRAKGPRLYLDPRRKQFVIRDGAAFIRTGCGERNGGEAEKILGQYIARKHKPQASGAPLIADVLSVYGNEVAPGMKSARNIAYNISNLLGRQDCGADHNEDVQGICGGTTVASRNC